jgi:large subunit ribosomal protein L4
MKLHLHGKESTIEVADAAFGAAFNEPLVHHVVTAYLAGGRSGTKAQKNRSDVRGGGAKPWRQKGTGRARVGEIRNPLWRKGGTVFGPRPRDDEYHLPRKMFRAALRSALALKLKENQLNVVDAFTLDTHKTKAFAQALTQLGLDRKVLVVDHQENPNLQLAARNLDDVFLIANLQVTPYQLLNARHVVFSKASIQALEEALKK